MKRNASLRNKIVKYSRLMRYCLLPLAVLFVAVSVLKHFGYGISYQFSRSMPEGFYLYSPLTHQIHRNEIVLFRPPAWVDAYLINHGWLHQHMLMMKQVMALPGDHFCIRNHAVYINGDKIAPVLSDYAPGKPLPKLHYCQVVPANQYVLMSTHINRSFDARYFGPINRHHIIERAWPLLVRNT